MFFLTLSTWHTHPYDTQGSIMHSHQHALKVIFRVAWWWWVAHEILVTAQSPNSAFHLRI